MHPGQRGHEQELGHEVPVGDGVDGVGRGRGEAELLGHLDRVERQRRAGQRAGAERGDRGPRVPVAQPVEVAQQRLHVGEQLMAEGDRLGRLQVGQTRRGRVDVPVGLLDERVGQLDDPRGDPAGVVAQVEPQVGGDLVVAGPAGAQLAAERAEPLQQAAFERGVHVLVVDRGPELAGRAGRLEVVQRGQHPAQLVGVEQAGAGQHPSVRAGGGQIVRREAPVELDTHGQPGKGFRGAAGEPAAPQSRRSSQQRPRGHLSTGDDYADRASRAAASRLGRPHRSTKPLARDWSNVSPAS